MSHIVTTSVSKHFPVTMSPEKEPVDICIPVIPVSMPVSFDIHETDENHIWNYLHHFFDLISKNLSSSYPFYKKNTISFLENKKTLIIIIIIIILWKNPCHFHLTTLRCHGSRKVAAKISKILLASVTWMEVIPSQIMALWLQLMSTSGPGDFLFRDFSGIVFVGLFPAVIYLYIVGSPTWSEHMSLSINIYIELHWITKMYMYIYNILYGCKVHLVSNSRHIPKKQSKHQ